MANLTATMSTDQEVAIGVTVFDKSRPTPKPYLSTADYPPGVVTTFVSDHPEIVEVQVRPDGLNADCLSTDVGTAVVTVTTTGLPPDTVTFTVTRAAPGSQNTTVGAPTEEP